MGRSRCRDCLMMYENHTPDRTTISSRIRYTVGSGKGSEAREVLIFSWDIAAEPAGLF